MILCGSALRPPASSGPLPLLRLADDAGFQGIAVDGGCFLSDVPALAEAALKVGLAVPAIFGPIAETPLPPGKRLPFLASTEDKEERIAAINLAGRAIEQARDVGATVLGLGFGLIRLTRKRAELRRYFSRSELGEGDPGHRLLTAVLTERRGRSQEALDAARGALERLVRAAEAASVTIAIGLGANPWEIPSPREAIALVDEFRGAPVGLVASPARLAVLATMGVGGTAEREAAIAAHARLLHATEAVGLEYDLLPGLGEPSPVISTPPSVPVIVSGRPDSTVDEVIRARELVEGQLRKRADPAVAS